MHCSGPSKPWEKSLHVQERLPVVLAGRVYSSYSLCDPRVAKWAIPPKIGRSTLRSWAEILSRDPEWPPHSPDLIPPRLLLMGVLEESCIWEQPQDNPWTEKSNNTEHQSHTKRGCISGIGDFASRLKVWLQWSSGHLEHILQCPVKVVKTVADLYKCYFSELLCLKFP